MDEPRRKKVPSREAVADFMKGAIWEGFEAELDELEATYAKKLRNNLATPANIHVILGLQISLGMVERFRRIPLVWMRGKEASKTFEALNAELERKIDEWQRGAAAVAATADDEGYGRRGGTEAAGTTAAG